MLKEGRSWVAESEYRVALFEHPKKGLRIILIIFIDYRRLLAAFEVKIQFGGVDYPLEGYS